MEPAPSYSGHRQRLRMRYEKNPDELLDYEIIELLLTFAIPRRDVKPLAKRILKTFGSFYAVFDASSAQLMEIDGVGERTATLISLMRHTYKISLQSKLNIKCGKLNIQALGDYIRLHISNTRHECCHILAYGAEGELLLVKEMPGRICDIKENVGKIINFAVINKASDIVLIHNHPDDRKILFSKEDVDTTQKLRQALRLMDIDLFDHIIVCGKHWYRFSERYRGL